MEITLTSELQALVEEQVRTGLYQNASEVMSDAPRPAWIDPHIDSAASEKMLLEGMEGTSIPWNKETMDRIRREALSGE